MTRPIIVQLSPFPVSETWLERCRQEVDLQLYSREELLTGISHLHYNQVIGLVPTIQHPVDELLMKQFPQLKVIANYGAGFNNIDLDAATRLGIQVTNTPGILSEAVADLTWGLLIACARRLVESDQTVRKGQFTGWAPDFQLGIDVSGKTLGIVGMGQIGKAVTKRAQGFQMTVLYHNRHRLSEPEETQLNAQYRAFHTLISESDFISIHTPLTEETHHLFSETVLRAMKPGAILINTSRGPLIDEAALARVLQERHLYAAGLDVYEREPMIHPELLPLDNVILAAHIGSATESTRKRMGDLALQNLLQVLQGKTPLNPVNQLQV